MSYNSFTNIKNLDILVITICNFKNNIVKLKSRELTTFKKTFYSLSFSMWQLNLLWEMIWEDRSVDEVIYIFSSKKLLKEGDIIGKINRFEKEKNNC